MLWWLGLTWLIQAPSGRPLTVLWWPALLHAAYLAWSQALCWTLVRTPLLRLIMVILVLPSVALMGVLVWATYGLEITITQLNLGLCALIGLAYVAAVAGVARDRRGDRLGWAWLGPLLLRAVPRWAGRERRFASPQAAQRWLEVRRHSWLLPAFVGFFLALLFWGMALPLGQEDVARIAVAIVGVPALLAFFVGFGMGKTSFWARNLELSSYIATRPVTCTALAHAKLYAAGLSALATWGLVLLLAPLWAVVSGNVQTIRALCDGLFHDQPAWKLGLLAPAALAGLVGLTWLQIVAGMCLSLTGRAAVVNAVVLFYVAVGAVLARLVTWTAVDPGFFDTMLTVLWWLGGSLGLLKLSAAAWAWSRRGTDFKSVLQDGTAARLALWLAVVACLLVPLYALVPENSGPIHLVALFVVLALPLTRLLALPAAVAWNRHRL
jgi:hypothetical protein